MPGTFQVLGKLAQMSSQTDVLSIGVDAYSAIFRGFLKQQQGFSVVKDIEKMVVMKDRKTTKFYQHGYQGLVCDLFYYGVKDNSLLLGSAGAFSGVVEEKCSEFWPDVTRIDLQVTVQLPEKYDDMISQTAREQLRLSEIKKRWADVRHMESEDGSTLYVGKREAEVMLRLYDKGRDYGVDTGFVFRFEVQYRNDKAKRIADGIARADGKEGTILKTVFNAYYDKGIRVPVSYCDKSTVLNPPEKKTSNDEYLAWARQVLGGTTRTLQGFSEGQELLRELGIQTSFLDMVDLQDKENGVELG